MIFTNILWIILVIVIVPIILEVISYFLINYLKKKFQWLITPKDELPYLDPEGLKKFFNYGYDPELGWVRKPNTWHNEYGREGETRYNIGKNGARKNPGHEKLPKIISCYGDSFTFSRQVNDNETWEWHLSNLTKTNVLNFGVGNYGIDQSLLRMKREYPKNKTKIVLLGIVPSTIVRILCIWKHYNEFGNTFGFKPMFMLRGKKLILIKNIINTEKKFYDLKPHINHFKKYDYFYKTKFRKEMIKFPYFFSIIKNPGRNFTLIFFASLSTIAEKLRSKKYKEKFYEKSLDKIMRINIKLRYDLFKEAYPVKLFEAIVEEFVRYGKRMKFTPVFVLLPQKDDVLFVKEKEYYYRDFIDFISKKVVTINLTEDLLEVDNLGILYSHDNVYGGHYSKYGNKFVAEIIYKHLKEKKVI